VFDDKIFRRLRIGDLADVVMLDTRLFGRDMQAVLTGADVSTTDPTIADPSRTLLGFDQERWLAEQLSFSKQRGATWRILGQQVMMAQLSTTFGRTILNPDQWDGYAPARERLFTHLRENGINNNVVLTGDIHSSWCNDLTSNPFDPAQYNPATGQGVLGAEFVTPGVTSPGILDPAQATALAQQLRFVSPHVKYLNLFRRGYSILDLNRERELCEIYHVPTVSQRVAGEELAASFVSVAGDNVVRPLTTSVAAIRDERAPLPATAVS
jgi:alkaline phosphatase D